MHADPKAAVTDRAVLTGAQYDFGGPVLVPEADVVTGYVASWPPEAVGLTRGATWSAVLAEADAIVRAHVAEHGAFRVTGRAAAFVCR